jgi:asparagine synthase (glutamine-hydrolysing)
VILHLYQEHGEECVHHLRGMFAFALWDGARNRLVLARDRMGEKPLYLYESAGELLFASELTALLASEQVPFELEPAHVDLFFHYQYVPEPATPLRGVRKLPPGHLLTVDVDPWRVAERCYWRIDDAPPIDGDPAEVIRSELRTIGTLVSQSDVPIGVALSGGLDSSTVAALVAGSSPDPLHAFTVGYRGRPDSDERSEAKELARALGMEFHELELDGESLAESFPSVVRAWDDPIADMSGYCYWAVARLASEHGVRVLMQGQGGDELFWGYPWVRQAMADSELKAALWDRGWGKAYGQLTFYDLNPDFRAASEAMSRFYPDRFRSEIDPRGPWALFMVTPPRAHPAVDMTRLIYQTYLLENGMAQGDRLSMASSVELRLPLVDHRLVEKVIGLRKTRPDHRLPPKAWLREAVKDLLPEGVVARRKRPFSPPVREWHRRLFASYGHLLENGLLVDLGVLRPQAACDLARGAFPSGAGATLSFKALVLEMWCRRHRCSG